MDYKNSYTKVCIICPEHGEFWQAPHIHLNGPGCMKCIGREKVDTEVIINRAKNVFGDMYDYSKVEFVNARTKNKNYLPRTRRI